MTILGFNDEPDYVNDEGTKWWLDKSTTDWAQRKDAHGTSLDMEVWLVETKDGYMARLLLDADLRIIDEQQNLEQLAVKIDMLKASIRLK